MRKYLTICEEAVSHICMTLQPIPSEFPYDRYEENFIFFFISVLLVTFVYLHVL